jgi:hypothetical protein|tara:strand:+ start:325 stop:522 length:198 start_codon:yes stop_codon:yes gene_type:complete
VVVDDVVFLGDKYHQSDVENGVLSVNTPKYKGFQGGVQHLSSRLFLSKFNVLITSLEYNFTDSYQ